MIFFPILFHIALWIFIFFKLAEGRPKLWIYFIFKKRIEKTKPMQNYKFISCNFVYPQGMRNITLHIYKKPAGC